MQKEKKQGQYSSIVTEQEKVYFMTKKKTLFLQDKVETNPEQKKDAY